METRTTMLSQLRPGHEYPGESVNSRTAYRDADIQTLAASLLNEGQIYPLLVCSHPETPRAAYVVDGNRRLRAFGKLIESGRLPVSADIEIIHLGAITPNDALRKSWATNDTVPLHPADRAQVFAKMNITDDLTPAQIAERHGMTVMAVKQSIAYGAKLAPEILQAWREGEITMDLAKLFTLGDHPDQAALLGEMRKKYKRRGKDWAEGFNIETEVRKALAGNEADAARFLKFVGENAYVAEGGRIVEDLFADKGVSVVQDIGKLRKLAKAKLQKKADALAAEGWSWVDVQMAPHFNSWNYDSSKDKKKAGCIVRIAGTKVEVKSGLVKKLASLGSGNGNASAKREEPAHGYKARDALDDAISGGIGETLATNIPLALAAFLASTTSYNSPFPEAEQMVSGDNPVTKARTFKAAFADLRHQRPDRLVALFVKLLGSSVRMEAGDEFDPEFIGALDQAQLATSIAKNFEAKKYFDDCSKPLLLECIEDALGEEQKRLYAGKEKSALAKFCIASVTPTGWLPPQLRTKAYAGPGAAKAPSKKKAA